MTSSLDDPLHDFAVNAGCTLTLLESLRAFWDSLFGRRRAEAAGEGGEVEERRAPPRPFASYGNPFHDGRAEGMSPAELVRYSFEALEAWASEHDLPRMADETPIEFADRVGGDVPAVEAEAKRLAALYARVLYAKGGVPANWRRSIPSDRHLLRASIWES